MKKSKAENLRQKIASLTKQLRVAEVKEKEARRAEIQRRTQRRERAVLAAARTAGLLALNLTTKDFEREFRQIAKRNGGQESLAFGTNNSSSFQEDLDGNATPTTDHSH